MVNASFDRERDKWMALQRRAMMESSVYVREFLYHDFARKLTQLGYNVEPSKDSHGFEIAGISEEAKRTFSERANQRIKFEGLYKKVFGHQPSKRRVGQFIADLLDLLNLADNDKILTKARDLDQATLDRYDAILGKNSALPDELEDALTFQRNRIKDDVRILTEALEA
ncbi:MAG: hypothetical protein ACI9R3_005619 [Verrucomicrobiales bacterium]|jgi:hypothetical protein